MSKVRDYYVVELPGDLTDTIEHFKQIAIDEARERAKLYCVPCEWTATLMSGEIGSVNITFRVCRVRNKPEVRIKDEIAKALSQKICDDLMFISGINTDAKVLYPAMSETQLAGGYSKPELFDKVYALIRNFKA